jgi:mannitol 2-dehydrogenase
MTKLSLAALAQINPAVPTPAYKRADLSPGILHFGVGNFHRAHLGVYLDKLFNKGLDHDWAIVGAGVMAFDESMREKLAAQDFLTTIVEMENEKSAARVTGPMVDFIAPADKAALIAKLADPAIRIVSMTITEGGYFVNPATGAFDPAHPAIVRDAAHPDDPATVFGFIVAGLKRRRAAGIAPFTVMSCDNVPHNGVVTRNAVAGLARLSDPALADWIDANVACPNAMVDRIATVTNDRERTMLKDQFGIEDAWPVFCEDYIQWVIEDHFPAGRPAFEKAGATFVKDVTPYETMKIRILNGGHAVIAYPGGLLDVHFVHEAMQHPLIKAFLDKVEFNEILPIVPPVPNTNLRDYCELIIHRFANPKIGDTIRRLALDGSNRQPKFIVPSIRDRLAKGLSVEGLALESALWCRYCFGVTETGKTIEPNDPQWDRLQGLAREAKHSPAAWLGMADIYGDTAASPVFQAAFAKWLGALWRQGTEATLKDYVGGKSA